MPLVFLVVIVILAAGLGLLDHGGASLARGLLARRRRRRWRWRRRAAVRLVARRIAALIAGSPDLVVAVLVHGLSSLPQTKYARRRHPPIGAFGLKPQKTCVPSMPTR